MRGIAFLSIVSSALASISNGEHSAEDITFNTKTGVCGASTWNTYTAWDPAIIESCKKIIEYARSLPSAGWLLKGWIGGIENSMWTLCTDGCVFEVRVLLGDQVAPISFTDLADVTRDAIEKFGYQNNVSAYGWNTTITTGIDFECCSVMQRWRSLWDS
ncbi:hypothetical protein NPX13_g4243 [Xylaria arbuscula]|uniref:Ecp2 effector protein-like domain-containing protein n=1 Tax=Xylaria arbuscula TaxID=114810 RepID=A0A9W8TNI8_9PEZI|nr:hypothetical protein NPX13_g4243 [Xylaria arbuscula]